MQERTDKRRMEKMRREAKKIARSTDLTHYQALDLQAQKLGYASWADLNEKWNLALAGEASHPPEPLDQVVLATRLFLNSCSDNDIYWLCRGGSLWVRASEVKAGDLKELRFVVMGSASDSVTIEESKHRRLLLLSDYESIDGLFVFEGDTDTEGIPIEPELNQQIWFEPSVARKMLIELAEDHVADGFYVQIEPILPD